LINYFGALVSNCDDQLSLADRSRKKSAILSTYFYSKLMGEDEIYSYDSVTRWTKDVDIFKLDKILIPINENQSHWIVVKVSMSQKSIELYDPMGQRQNPNNYLNNVFHFIKDEHLKRKAEVLPDTSNLGSDSLPCKTQSSQRNPMALTVGSLSRHLSIYSRQHLLSSWLR
jgi:Ulp1 family protease